MTQYESEPGTAHDRTCVALTICSLNRCETMAMPLPTICMPHDVQQEPV